MIKNNERTILVTGATGTVGSEVVKQLLASSSSSSSSGHNIIRAAVHSQNKADKLRHENNNKDVEIVNTDYNKPETLKEALKNVDRVFLLTPFQSDMVQLSSNLVTEAKKAGIRHIVKQSAIGADMEADVTALRLHRQAEKIIEDSGISCTFLRPNEFMQNIINFHSHTIKSNNAFYFPREDAKVSFVDVRDIAAVAVKILTDDDGNDDRHEGKAYTITGPEALSYYQVAEILSNATGRKIGYVNVSDKEARRAMKDMGWDDSRINNSLEVSDYFRKGYGSQVSSAVEEVTGRKPITFAQFAKDYAEVLDDIQIRIS
jgi:uncharacterized protein YbjT (DUF2867 family)